MSMSNCRWVMLVVDQMKDRISIVIIGGNAVLLQIESDLLLILRAELAQILSFSLFDMIIQNTNHAWVNTKTRKQRLHVKVFPLMFSKWLVIISPRILSHTCR